MRYNLAIRTLPLSGHIILPGSVKNDAIVNY